MSKPYLINIRGCNGSGKSTIPKQMIQSDPEYRVVKKGDICLTICPTYRFIIVGTYIGRQGQMLNAGGMDKFKNTAITLKNIDKACELANKWGDYDIIAEGVIASTVKDTYRGYFKHLKEQGIVKPSILIYTTPVDVCIDRIYRRNGNKPIVEQLVESKHRTITNQIEYWREHGFSCLPIDNSNTKEEHMLSKFLNLKQKWRDKCERN